MKEAISQCFIEKKNHEHKPDIKMKRKKPLLLIIETRNIKGMQVGNLINEEIKLILKTWEFLVLG